ncbi:MAG: aminoacyl-tRNA hydrolase [Patescibacteria group bacterium]
MKWWPFIKNKKTDDSSFWLLVGLGNPGKRYSLTKHNAGRLWLEDLNKSDKWQGQELSLDNRLEGLLAQGELWGQSIYILLPEVFMNNSGKAVINFKKRYGLNPANLIVVHDDVDLDWGMVRSGFDRGAGGHKGVSNIFKHLGSSSFFRLRLGVGRPPAGQSVSDYVLRPATVELQEPGRIWSEADSKLKEIITGNC